MSINQSSSPLSFPSGGISSSPFFTFSAETLKEHNQTLLRLRQQLELIARARADLDADATNDSTAAEARIDALMREEELLLRRVHSAASAAGQIEASMQDDEARAREATVCRANDDNAAREELSNLDSLEAELIAMANGVEGRLNHAREQLRICGKALQDGLSLLETDRHEVRLITASAQRTLSNDPISMVRALSPNRTRQQESVYQGSVVSRSASNNSYNQATTAALNTSVAHDTSKATYAVSTSRNVSPTRASTGSPYQPSLGTTAAQDSTVIVHQPSRSGGGLVSPNKARTSNYCGSTTQASVYSNASALSTSGVLTTGTQSAGATNPLLAACAKLPMDAVAINQMLRERQSLVDAMDELGNTPLHVACMSPNPNLDAIHALLLAGANAAAKNGSGLTPFHLACLNVRGDPEHHLKRFLLFQGAQNPNQRTARGETAAHLCAEHDQCYDVLVFLNSVGVDMDVAALLRGPDGAPRRMTALDVARLGGARSARNAEFLRTVTH